MLPVEANLANRIDVLARKHHTRFTAVGYAPPISDPIFIDRNGDSWWLIPEEQSTVKYPLGVKRNKRIFEDNFPVAQWIVGDECPRVLTYTPEPKPPRDWTPVKEKVQEYGEVAGKVAVATAKTAVVAAGIASVVVTGIAYAALMTMGQLLIIDPVLIAVTPTPNGTVWVRVARWYV